jgi:hypothetical protein
MLVQSANCLDVLIVSVELVPSISTRGDAMIGQHVVHITSKAPGKIISSALSTNGTPLIPLLS